MVSPSAYLCDIEGICGTRICFGLLEKRPLLKENRVRSGGLLSIPAFNEFHDDRDAVT